MTGDTDPIWSADDIWQAIERADGMPAGRARIALLDSLLQQISRPGTAPGMAPGSTETGADGATAAELATAVRVSLIPACLDGGDHQRIPALLAELLAQYDQAPSWFGAWERHSVLFCFNWATAGLLQHPDVPLAELERLLALMAERYAAAGVSMAPALRARFLLEQHVHGPVAATAAFEAWRAAGRSELSECEDCERTEQIRQLAALGRHQEAVDLARPVLAAGPAAGCAAQPMAAIGAVLESLLATGWAEQAAAEHVRGVRLIRDRPGDAAAAGLGRADHLRVCARSGRLQRGLDLLEEWLPWYATVGPPSRRLETAAAAGRLLRGLAETGQGGLVLAADGSTEPTTVDELGARLADEARDLAARFDARNGTSTVGDRGGQILDAAALPDLPLDALTRSPRSARVRPTAGGVRRGRRAAGRDVPEELPTGGPNELAAGFDQALRADAHDRCDAVLALWREQRDRHEPSRLTGAGRPIWSEGPTVDGGPTAGARERAAARLDGWLALSRAADQAERLEPAGLDEAGARLRAAGLPIEALLHEQAGLLAAAQAGRVDLGPARRRVEQIAIEVGERSRALGNAGLGDVGLALSRLVLVRELAARHGADHGSDPSSKIAGEQLISDDDPLDAGLAALGSVPPDQLDHQQLRAVSRLLRLRARDEPLERAVETLRASVAVLPDGVRPLERALAGADLAGLLADVDPPAALIAWDQSISDAETASAAATLGTLLAASASLRAGLGDPGRAGADLTRAIPLLDQHSPGPLAAQARLDLSRVRLVQGRAFEAAETAEAGLADLTDRLDLNHGEAHVAGCLALSAAEANRAAGARDRARELARRSAHWHQTNHNLIAEAEAWELAAHIGQLGGPPEEVAADFARAVELAETGGDWVRAANCRRERIIAVKDADGLDAALTAVSEAEDRLAARVDRPAGRHAPEAEQRAAGRLLHWHQLALVEQRARLLAVGGRFPEAMAQVDGLEKEYHGLGDDWSARDLLGLRGQLRAELGDLDGALDDLRRAAEEAELAGDPAQAHGLGERLATVLDAAGRDVEAEAAWQRFRAPGVPPASR